MILAYTLAVLLAYVVFWYARRGMDDFDKSDIGPVCRFGPDGREEWP